MDERFKVFEDKMKKTIEVLSEEYASVRAGRANPHLIDKIKVDYYGTPSPINAVANVSFPSLVGLIPISAMLMAFSISLIIFDSQGWI